MTNNASAAIGFSAASLAVFGCVFCLSQCETDRQRTEAQKEKQLLDAGYVLNQTFWRGRYFSTPIPK